MPGKPDDRCEAGQGSGHLEDIASKRDNDWHNRPPYRTTEANESFKKRHTAHCHCGAPFQWAAIFHKEDLHFENGAQGLAFYHAPTRNTHYELPVKVSCAYCHSPIMDEGRNMVLMFPGIIKFENAEDKKLFDPQCHIFYSQRVVDLPDGKPKWTGLDTRSELMKDVESHEAETVVGERKIE
ncbi:hypothetical protein O1611_g5745 [Lasiodiplodia mahajangana]|uniref:Uncharacterized protein n=1 Tax=Lasiodiplodia mahajangana TaxID=1108764 RepID=A0ACC2JKM0_9PEZI|nr:hypothetical protein O1611_g5745 [Lasiodiplodia mahajangana]